MADYAPPFENVSESLLTTLKFAFDYTEIAELATGVATGIILPQDSFIADTWTALSVPVAWNSGTAYAGVGTSAADAVGGVLTVESLTTADVIYDGNLYEPAASGLFAPAYASGGPAELYLAVTNGSGGPDTSTAGKGLLIVTYSVAVNP